MSVVRGNFGAHDLQKVGLEATPEGSAAQSAEELVRELVCQRLAQDFQIITAHDGAGEKLSGGLKYHLMFRHIIHKLTFDAASRNIEVTIYTHTRKSEALSAASVYYQ